MPVKYFIKRLFFLFLVLFAFPLFLLIRVIRPFILIRIGTLVGERIGHLAGNVEQYLCEKDAGINIPSQLYFDIFFYESRSICNMQLDKMWRQIIYIFPRLIMKPIYYLNTRLPGGDIHLIGRNIMHDQDVRGLLERFPKHLKFTDQENLLGKKNLVELGIPEGEKYICLIVRDCAYLNDTHPEFNFSYHDFRDSSISNYVVMANTLADKGFYVVRMGAKVNQQLNSEHPKVIDYATNGARTEFMDLYLGAHCYLCVSTATGWDAIPTIFRRPVVFVNMMPIGINFSYKKVFLGISKHHFSIEKKRNLTLSEIFKLNLGFCNYSSDYICAKVEVRENSPEEIRDLALEAIERLSGKWQDTELMNQIQKDFWEKIPRVALNGYDGRPKNGIFQSRHGTKFLLKHPNFLS